MTPPDGIEFANYELASPTLLAMQPPTAPGEEYNPNIDWDITFTHLESRLNSLKMWRYSWWTYWAQLAEYILPRRYFWLVTANLMTKGYPINQAIMDPTGTMAMEICAAGMVDGLVPTSRPWVKIGIGIPGTEEDRDAKIWLEDTEEKFYRVAAQSNFYNQMAQVAQDEVVFGTGVSITYEDPETVIREYVPCTGEFYLATGSTFTVDVIYREFVLTISQAVEMFGLENCPSVIRELWRTGGGSIENEVVIAHAIEPNFPLMGVDGKKLDVVKGPFPFREFYWLRGQKTDRPLSRRGFRDKPFAVARWATTSNDAYGRSPGMNTLPDIKQLQLESRRKAEFIEKLVRPPMGADPALQNMPSSIRPGDVTYIDSTGGKKGFWALYEVQAAALEPMVKDILQLQTRIQKGFLVDVFMAITNMEGVQPRNDLEIAERKAEKLQRLGPVIGLWKSEFISPKITRILNIMRRRGLLLPLPKSLRGVPLKFTYLDMVTLAQQGAEVAGMERTMAQLANMSAAAAASGLPVPLRIIDMDQTARIYAERALFPSKAILTPEQVAKLDQAKAANARAAAAAHTTTAMVEGAKTLGQADLGGGQTLLGKIAGNSGAPQQ